MAKDVALGKKKKGVYVRMRCVGCKATRDIFGGEVPAGEHPMCTACFLPLATVSAGRTG